MANGNGKRLPQPKTGTADPPGAWAAKGTPHHEYFNQALDDAISQIDQEDWPKPASYDVTLTYEARIDVKNPGGVGQYRVTVS